MRLAIAIAIALCGCPPPGDTGDTAAPAHFTLVEDETVVHITEEPRAATPCPDRDCGVAS